MKIGFTTGFPVEILFAAGHTPIDLNNIFISGQPLKDVRKAESEGLPRNICSWIKGIHNTVITEEIKTVIGVVQGDCSNTHSLMSLFKDKGVDVITFSFPYDKDRNKLSAEINSLASQFDVTTKQITDVKKELDDIRKLLTELDRLTYQENKVSGKENHYWLVSSSDFFGEPLRFKKELLSFLQEAKQRKPLQKPIRLAYIGVPPIFTDFYDFFDNLDAGIVFNEVQRQFSMPFIDNECLKETGSQHRYISDNRQIIPADHPLIDQYLNYTYPYSVFDRLKDIQQQAAERDISGIISYSQAFCHRQIDNILLKKYLPYPFLTIEGDFPDKLDERTKLRLESFLDMIRFAD